MKRHASSTANAMQFHTIESKTTGCTWQQFPKNMVETAQFLGLITCKDIHGTWNETQTAASWRTTPQDPNQP